MHLLYFHKIAIGVYQLQTVNIYSIEVLILLVFIYFKYLKGHIFFSCIFVKKMLLLYVVFMFILIFFRTNMLKLVE